MSNVAKTILISVVVSVIASIMVSLITEYLLVSKDEEIAPPREEATEPSEDVVFTR